MKKKEMGSCGMSVKSQNPCARAASVSVIFEGTFWTLCACGCSRETHRELRNLLLQVPDIAKEKTQRLRHVRPVSPQHESTLVGKRDSTSMTNHTERRSGERTLYAVLTCHPARSALMFRRSTHRDLQSMTTRGFTAHVEAALSRTAASRARTQVGWTERGRAHREVVLLEEHQRKSERAPEDGKEDLSPSTPSECEGFHGCLPAARGAGRAGISR
jgi:hypothetical protein